MSDTHADAEDVRYRLRDAGVLAAADDDRSGTLDADEQQALADGLEHADALVAEALAPWDVPDLPNEWLRQAATALAVEHVAGRGGAVVPASVAELAQRWRDKLERVRTGGLSVPGLKPFVRPRRPLASNPTEERR